MKKAVTIGMFDGVHRGHLCLIGQLQEVARKHGLSPVAITMDAHPREVLTGEHMPLLTTHDEKLALLSQHGVEVETLHFTRELAALTARRFMAEVLAPMGVTVLVMGYDHRFGHDGRTASLADFTAWGRAEGIEVVTARELEGSHVSSSAIRRALIQGDVREAARLLGRPYSVTGTVVGGKQVGRELGFPTANLLPSAGKMLPAEGVYATRANGMAAMTNIGRRPTIDSDARPTVETHIIGFDGDLYGQDMTIEFIDKIRDTMRFASREALAAQLEKDAKKAKDVC